jgi:putative SOS response-associated peptidase YedK
MPVILPCAEYGLWLDPTFQDVERLQAVLRPYSDDEMVAYPVSTQVNNPANDFPEMIAPLTRCSQGPSREQPARIYDPGG